MSLASSYNVERAESLQFRFEQERLLLDHAWKRVWFGWGRFGRNRVYNEEGKDISVTDGRWIITMGSFGFVGFAAEFGLLALSVFSVWPALGKGSSGHERTHLAALRSFWR